MRTITPDAYTKPIKTLPFKLTEREKRGETFKGGCCRAWAGQKDEKEGKTSSSPHNLLKSCRTRTPKGFSKPLGKTEWEATLYHAHGFIRTPFRYLHPTVVTPPPGQSPHQEVPSEQQHTTGKGRCGRQQRERGARAGPSELFPRKSREN